MTVREFCRNKTRALELCVIRDSGWIVHTVWIDYEDIFVISKQYEHKEIKMKTYIQITGGRGPVECARTVALVAKELQEKYKEYLKKKKNSEIIINNDNNTSHNNSNEMININH